MTRTFAAAGAVAADGLAHWQLPPAASSESDSPAPPAAAAASAARPGPGSRSGPAAAAGPPHGPGRDCGGHPSHDGSAAAE